MDKRPTVTVYLKFFKRVTSRGLPIYYNFPLLTTRLPTSWRDFEPILRKARNIAERLLYQRLGRRVKKLELFVPFNSFYFRSAST